MSGLSAAYDAAMSAADAGVVGVGRSTTRVWDFVEWGEEWDQVWMDGRLLEACAAVIGVPFKLSSTMGRTLRGRTAAQALHRDLPEGSGDGPMVGFILMVDGFTESNGATRFVCEGTEVTVCGAAGDLIVFDSGVVHGHGANVTDGERRSVQGYFVRREVRAGRGVSGETMGRVGDLGRWLVGGEL